MRQLFKFQAEGEWHLMLASNPEHWPKATKIEDVNDPMVTIDALVDSWCSALEGENYHSMMDVPRNLVNVLLFVGCSDKQVKEAMWEILTTQEGWL